MPINKKYPIAELIEACRTYPGASNARRITFEYVMLKGVNDSLADARALVKLVAGIPAKINLIPFNPWPGAPYECSDWSQIEKFAEIVNRPAMPRRSAPRAAGISWPPAASSRAKVSKSVLPPGWPAKSAKSNPASSAACHSSPCRKNRGNLKSKLTRIFGQMSAYFTTTSASGLYVNCYVSDCLWATHFKFLNHSNDIFCSQKIHSRFCVSRNPSKDGCHEDQRLD